MKSSLENLLRDKPTRRSYTSEARSKISEHQKQSQENIATAAKSSFSSSALEAKESIQGEKEARNKIEEVRKKIEGNRMLLMVDVRFARHKLEEASKDMKTHGLQPHENFTKNKTKASEKGRAERKIKMIRNALNLIRAVS